MPQVELTYLSPEWTNGEDYSVNCEMCQGTSAGLARMIPLPTVKVRLSYDGQSTERYFCKSCIDNGVKTGQLKETNEQPKGCPFSM